MAIAAIDAVHSDGDLPQIPVYRDNARDHEGVYFCDTQTGSPLRITISRYAQFPALSCLHEIGHFLDHQALGMAGRFASEADAALAEWRSAISRSRPFQWLTWLRSVDDANQAYVEYVLSWPELFARAYAQLIAERSESVSLQRQLDEIRLLGGAQIYPVYWETADFVPIAATLDQLFLLKGWRQ